MDYAEILSVYEGSDGDATKRLYERLDAIGPEGSIWIDGLMTWAWVPPVAGLLIGCAVGK